METAFGKPTQFVCMDVYSGRHLTLFINFISLKPRWNPYRNFQRFYRAEILQFTVPPAALLQRAEPIQEFPAVSPP